MKSVILTCLSIVLFSAEAYGSKARVQALGSPNWVVDTQTVFRAPTDLLQLGGFITFEMGAAGTGGAEGGFVRKLDSGAKVLAYFGHQNMTASAAAGDIRTDAGYIPQNNPVEIIYAKDKMAFGGSLSNVDNKKSSTKETSLIGKWGMLLDTGKVYAHLHLISTAEKAGTGGNDKLTAGPYIIVGGDHRLSDKTTVYGQLSISQGNIKPNGGTEADVKDTNITLGYESTALKTKKSRIFYGLKFVNDKRDFGGGEKSAMKFPAYAGIEHQTLSWLVSRASISQNILLGSSKDTTGNSKDADGIAPDTAVSAGLGLIYEDLRFDGTLEAASNGKINGNQFLSTVSATFAF